MSHVDRSPRGWETPVPGTAPGRPPGSRPGARGRLLAGGVIVVLLTAAVAAGVVAWQNRDAGAAWQERALAEEERADAAEAALAAERERAEALEARTADLEAEVAELESRVVALAGEKAGAEDEALVAQEGAERLQEALARLEATAEDLADLSRFATETGAALQRCIARSLELTDDIVTAVNADTLDPEATNRRITDVNEVCAAAQDEYAELIRRVDALDP